MFLLGHNYTRKAFAPNTSGLANLQWDSAELTQIGVQTQMSYDDVFTLEEVEWIHTYIHTWYSYRRIHKDLILIIF